MGKKTHNTFSLKTTPFAKPSSKNIGQKASSGATFGSLLPTPNSRDWKGQRAIKNYNQPSIYDKVKSLSSQVGFPASPSHKLVFGRVRMMNDTCGQRCLGLFENSDQDGSSLKMLSDFLLYKTDWCLSRCAPIWKVKITKSNRMLYQLAPSVHRIDETESGLLPTPRVSEAERAPVKNAEYKNGRWSRINQKGVRFGVKVKDVLAMIPTPTQVDYKSRGPNSKQVGVDNLMKMLGTPRATQSIRSERFRKGRIPSPEEAVAMLPTPRAGNPGSRPNKKGGKILNEEVGKGTGLKLQPAFVEWMMGFPEKWCDFPMVEKSPTPGGEKKD